MSKKPLESNPAAARLPEVAQQSSPPAGSSEDPSAQDSAGRTASSPLVSVIIPAYNAERFIERTLQSVLDQSYKNIEVLVVDDGSTDRTREIVSSVARRDARTRILLQPHVGVAAARNYAIGLAKGTLIAPLDADDLWHRNKLEYQVASFRGAGPALGLVYSWSMIIDENDVATVGIAHDIRGDVFAETVCSNFVGNGSAALIRRECIEAAGGFKPRLVPCEDWELYLRIAEGHEVEVVRKYHVAYRIVRGSGSADIAKMEESYRLLMTEVRQRHPHMPRRVLHLSRSLWCFYLSGKCNENRAFVSGLIFLLKALQHDAARLLSSEFYLALAKAAVRVIAVPIILVVTRAPNPWRHIKRHVKKSLGVHPLVWPIDHDATFPAGRRRLYDRIYNSRMARIKRRVKMHSA